MKIPTPLCKMQTATFRPLGLGRWSAGVHTGVTVRAQLQDSVQLATSNLLRKCPMSLDEERCASSSMAEGTGTMGMYPASLAKDGLRSARQGGTMGMGIGPRMRTGTSVRSGSRLGAVGRQWLSQAEDVQGCRAGSLGGVRWRRLIGGSGQAASRAVSKAARQSWGEATATEWDVLGLGQAMVDFMGVVDDAFLARLGLEKGRRRVVGLAERAEALKALEGHSYRLSAGGSLSNTLVGVSRLAAADGGRDLRVGLAGSVGGDPLGEFYRASTLKSGVTFLSEPVPDGSTGTVVVLTTPDAQRTMLSYQGTSSEIMLDDILERALRRSAVFLVEGYLLELPATVQALCAAARVAAAAGALVCITASDVTCVERNRDGFLALLRSCDILFSNTAEARALAGLPVGASPAEAARQLSTSCPLISVTDGDRGAFLAHAGHVVHVEAGDCVPMDTCGAGDAYASGLLYALLAGIRGEGLRRGPGAFLLPMGSPSLEYAESGALAPRAGSAGGAPEAHSLLAAIKAWRMLKGEGVEAEAEVLSSMGKALRKSELRALGMFASDVAAEVVAKRGTCLSEKDAVKVMQRWRQEEQQGVEHERREVSSGRGLGTAMLEG